MIEMGVRQQSMAAMFHLIAAIIRFRDRLC